MALALELKDRVDVINNLVGNDRKAIPNVLKSLKSEKKRLETKLSGVVSTEGSNDDWDMLKKEVKDMLDRLDYLQRRCKELMGEEHGSFLREAVVFSEKIKPYTEELEELWALQKYLQWLTRIRTQSDKITSAFPGSIDAAVNEYVSFVESCKDIEESECVQLKKYFSDMKVFWYSRLKGHLLSCLQGDLAAVGWPFVSGVLPTDSVWTTHSKRIRTTILLMFAVDLDYRYSPLSSLSDALPMVVSGLLDSIEKRFVYHFYGDKPTNDKSKPEWAFSQVLTWIRKHGMFIEDKIQPFLENPSYAAVNLKTEFIRGLLHILEVKLRDAIVVSDKVVQDEPLMSHWINELLQFEQELRALDYPYPLHSCSEILLEEIPFSKWIVIEKKLAVEKLSAVMSSPRAWSTVQGSMESADLSFVPECAEKLMGTIAGIKDRYHILHSIPHHLDFLNLQIYLLMEFHCDLATAMEQAQSSPLSSELLAYLNASHYIVCVLQQWGEEPFFLELAYAHQWITGEPPGKQLDKAFCKVDFNAKDFQNDFAKDHSLFHLSSAAFDLPIKAFQEIVNVIQGKMAKHIVNVFSTISSKKWHKEKWHVMPSPKDYAITDVSPGALDVLVVLRDSLHLVTRSISAELRGDIWSKVISGVDTAVMSEIVYVSHFSAGGAAQLKMDLVQNLVPLLTQCTDLSSEQVLSKSRDACTLLNMLPGSIKLMTDLLSPVGSGTAAEYDTAVASLRDMKIAHLTPMEAHAVLKRRMLE